MNETIWLMNEPGDEAETLSAKLGIPLQIAQILVNRKITDPDSAHKFLYGTLDDLHDPFLMKGMDKVVKRIQRAVTQGEKILIFGDYDVDGILSVVALSKAVESLGGKVDYFIPDRLNEGYGIKPEYIDIVLERKAGLVLSVDCGIKAVDFVEQAKRWNIDVVITDHHLPGPSLPDALVILNPVIDDCGYPDRYLAGIGVVFKLIHALLLDAGKEDLVPHYLKLVSIATVADVAVLKGENRLFVKYGLESLKNVSNLGLKSLLENCGLMRSKISVGDVGFRIGPRLNAAGRLGETDRAVRLFFSPSVEETRDIVFYLDKLNSKRQKIEEKIYNQSLNRIKKKALNERYKLLVLGCDEWHRGVIGIVASKLKDFFYQPVILLAYEGDKAAGSGRSIKEFSLIECLDKNKDHMNNHGGHTLAIGLELPLKNLAAFKTAVNQYTNTQLSTNDLKRKIKIDAVLNFNEIDSSLLEYMTLLSPFGMGNSKPVFLTKKAEVWGDPQKLKGKHSKFLVRQSGRIFEVIAWQKANLANDFFKGDKVDLTYNFQFSNYLGEERLSFSLQDIKHHGDPS